MLVRAPFALAVVVTALVGTGSGCAAAEAPEGLDDLSRFLFDRFQPAEGLEAGAQETEIRDAVSKIADEFAGQNIALDAPFTGTLKDLERDNVADLEGVGSRADDIELAQGFALANLTNCGIQQEVNLVMANRAMEIHPDVYESYDKAFDGDEVAFKNGDVDLMTWVTTYKIQTPPVGSAYEAKLRAGGRRVRGVEGEAIGDIFMTRVHLLEPAQFDGEGSSFDLDFQMEVYFEDGDGAIKHFYGMWRRMVLGPVDSSSELFIGQTLSGFVDVENRVDAACVEGRLDE
jgi:hypothetical protein